MKQKSLDVESVLSSDRIRSGLVQALVVIFFCVSMLIMFFVLNSCTENADTSRVKRIMAMTREVYTAIKPAVVQMHNNGDLTDEEWRRLIAIDASVRAAFNLALVALESYEQTHNNADKKDLIKAFADFENSYSLFCEVLGDKIENKKILYIGDVVIGLIKAWNLDNDDPLEKI